MQRIKLFSALIAYFLMTTGVAFAGNHASAQIPEPGTLSMLAVGATVAAILYRFKKDK